MSNTFGPNRRSIRLKEYDYASRGLYYITLCTQGRLMLFGEVINEAMVLSSTGQMVHTAWQGMVLYDPRVSLDEFMVMPNHLHGIIGIGRFDFGQGRCPAPTISLPDIVRRFKSWTTWRWREMNPSARGRLWQRNYCEHIIRDKADLTRIREYIRNNPKQWATDSDNPIP